MGLAETERFNWYESNAYRYYDTPDGQDLFKKLYCTTKYAFAAGMTLGLMSCYNTHPPIIGNKKRFFTVCKFTLPIVGVTAVYTITTYYATNYRKKDDPINHTLGGFAAGAVIGKLTNCTRKGIMSALFIGSMAYAQKILKQNNMTFFGPGEGKIRRNFSSFYMRHYDTSLMPDDIRGNWSKELPKE